MKGKPAQNVGPANQARDYRRRGVYHDVATRRAMRVVDSRRSSAVISVSDQGGSLGRWVRSFERSANSVRFEPAILPPHWRLDNRKALWAIECFE